MNHVPTEELLYSTFAGLEKTRFRVWLDESSPLQLELLETSDAGQGSFSLLFQGPEDRSLPQGSYIFEQEQIGSFELFIVPVGRSGGAIQFQAIFNRLPPRS